MWKDRLCLFAILFLITSLITVPISYTPTFAEDEYDEDYSNDPDYDGKTKLRFYQIFASQDSWLPSACEDRKNSFLRSKTIQVLRMYDYLPIISKMECVKVAGEIEIDKDKWREDSTYGLTLKQTIDRAKNWHYNLLIIILDKTFSGQYLKESFNVFPHGAWGHIVYDAKTIVSMTHWEVIEQPTATRTMAHEIAHFAVHEKLSKEKVDEVIVNYIRGEAVHEVDDEFDKCLLNDLLETCRNLWVTVKTHYGDPIPVMSPEHVMNTAELMKLKLTTPQASPPTPPSYNPEPEPEPVPVKPKQITPKVYPTTPSDDGVTYDSAHSRQLNQWAKFDRIQTKITELRSIYNYENENPDGQQKLKTAISKLEKFESDVENMREVLLVADNFLQRGQFGKAKITYDQTISRINNLAFYQILDVESAIDEAMKSGEIQLAPKKLPEWLKNNAEWWADDSITDREFTDGIEYLIESKILSISDKVKSRGSDNVDVPDWIKNNAKWWAEGKIGDDEFLSGIHYLVEEGIIKVRLVVMMNGFGIK